MNKKKINSVLKEVLEKVEPSKEDLNYMEDILKDFISEVDKKLKGLNVEIFVGGSFAKRTLIKKDFYDADVFLRFPKKKYKKNISSLVFNSLKSLKNFSVIHGSRDYFRVKINPNFFIELIPVKKIKKVDEAENITDLSYSHVKYINKKIKSDKILKEIKIAKAFCHAKECYGAESYIHGFSGYSLELLIYNYGSFTNFIKNVSKLKKGEKLVLDIEKHFKNKRAVLMDINTAKLGSPIVLVDPTYKHRNALAALSEETFEHFKKECKKFLKNPSVKDFERKVKDVNKIKQNALKSKNDFILLECMTKKQEGNVAGSKLMKFYKHLYSEIKKFYFIKNEGFNYPGEKSARYFFVGKPKKEIVLEGPSKEDSKNALRFRKKHNKVYEKKGKLYAKQKVNLSLNDFFKKWKIKNKKKIKEMSIASFKIINHNY